MFSYFFIYSLFIIIVLFWYKFCIERHVYLFIFLSLFADTVSLSVCLMVSHPSAQMFIRSWFRELCSPTGFCIVPQFYHTALWTSPAGSAQELMSHMSGILVMEQNETDQALSIMSTTGKKNAFSWLYCFQIIYRLLFLCFFYIYICKLFPPKSCPQS